MADSDLQREVARLRQELKVWEDRCNKLTKEKELRLKKADQQTLRIQELQSEIEHLQNVVQQIKVSKEAEVQTLKEQKREIELRLQQLSAEDIQDGVPILAKIASTSTAMSALEVSELKVQAPVAGFSMRSIHNSLVEGKWKGIDRLCDILCEYEKETEEENVVLWQAGTPWSGHAWKYCLRIYLAATPDLSHCISTFDKEIFPSLRCACQDGGCHLVSCVLDTSMLKESLVTKERHEGLVANEVKHADIAVFFLGSADSQQVTLELKSLLASDACTKAALICTGQQGRIPEIYSSQVTDLQKKFHSAVHCKIISEFDDSKEKCQNLLESLHDILKYACCVPSIPRISEDLAVSRIGILQDMKIEQEQFELFEFHKSKKDLIGVALCFDELQEYLHSDPTVSSSPFMLRSSPGEGKSALLVRWLSEIAEDGHVIVLSHFVTFPNSTSSQPEVMYRRFIQMLQHHYPESPSCPTLSYSDNVLKEFFLKSLGHAAAKCLGKSEAVQILVVIDNADRFEVL
jgi:hypothetical protein